MTELTELTMLREQSFLRMKLSKTDYSVEVHGLPVVVASLVWTTGSRGLA